MTTEEFLSEIKKHDVVRIDLGCGPKKKEGFFGVDVLALDGVDLVADLEKGLPFLPDNSVDEIWSYHFMEHLEHFDQMVHDVYRVLKPGGIHKVSVPHFSNPYYYSDPTHKRFFGLYTFDYFSPEEFQLKRKVPNFYTPIRFKILKRDLVFRSPFKFRNIFRRIIYRVFNINSFMQEWYEESWCYAFACNEIYFEMTPIK